MIKRYSGFLLFFSIDLLVVFTFHSYLILILRIVERY